VSSRTVLILLGALAIGVALLWSATGQESGRSGQVLERHSSTEALSGVPASLTGSGATSPREVLGAPVEAIHATTCSSEGPVVDSGDEQPLLPERFEHERFDVERLTIELDVPDELFATGQTPVSVLVRSRLDEPVDFALRLELSPGFVPRRDEALRLGTGPVESLRTSVTSSTGGSTFLSIRDRIGPDSEQTYEYLVEYTGAIGGQGEIAARAVCLGSDGSPAQATFANDHQLFLLHAERAWAVSWEEALELEQHQVLAVIDPDGEEAAALLAAELSREQEPGDPFNQPPLAADRPVGRVGDSTPREPRTFTSGIGPDQHEAR